MGLWGQHDGETILDFGCGPGNDVVGFLAFSDAAKVVGIDISMKALSLAAQRVALHEIAPERLSLIQGGDAAAPIPLETSSVGLHQLRRSPSPRVESAVDSSRVSSRAP